MHQTSRAWMDIITLTTHQLGPSASNSSGSPCPVKVIRPETAMLLNEALFPTPWPPPEYVFHIGKAEIGRGSVGAKIA